MNVIVLACTQGKTLGSGFHLGSNVAGNPSYENLGLPEDIHETPHRPGELAELLTGTLSDVFALEYRADRQLFVNTSGQLHYYLMTLRAFWGGMNVADSVPRSIGFTGRLSGQVLLPEYGSSECSLSHPYGTYQSHTGIVRLDAGLGFYPVARVKHSCNLDRYDLSIRLLE